MEHNFTVRKAYSALENLATLFPEEMKAKFKHGAQQYRHEYATAIAMTEMMAKFKGGEKEYGDGDQSEVSGSMANVVHLRWGRLPAFPSIAR